MTFESLSRYASDQPLTTEERQFLDAMPACPESARCREALDAAGVALDLDAVGSGHVRCGAASRPAVESLIGRHLWPLAAGLFDRGEFRLTQGLACLVLRLGLEACGLDHPRTLAGVSLVATCLRTLGYAAEALPLCRVALAARERMHGPDHVDTQACVNYLAMCLQSVGHAAEALGLYQRALAARESQLPETHLDTMTSVNNLAACLWELGRAEEALPLLRRAHAGREVVHGPEHPETLATLSNLAACLDSLFRHAEAEPLHRRALAAGERVRGTGHSDTLTSANNLAVCLEALGRSGEAIQLYQRVLRGRELALGLEHRLTMESLAMLASLLESLQFHGQAAVHRRTLASRLLLRPEPHVGWLELVVSTGRAIAARVVAGGPVQLPRLAVPAVGQGLAVAFPQMRAAHYGLSLRQLRMRTTLDAEVARWTGPDSGDWFVDWDRVMSGLSFALQRAVDLQSPEELDASRVRVLNFFATHLGLCIDRQRTDLIPQVLAARQGRKLAAMVLDEIESQAAFDADSPVGRLQSVRLELRRLALGLQNLGDSAGAPLTLPADRARLHARALDERRRAQAAAYKALLGEYQALRDELARTKPEFAMPARALEVALEQLQPRLAPDEALLLLFERDTAQACLALLITGGKSVLVPLANRALQRAGVLSVQWGQALHARAGMRRGVILQSELAGATRISAEAVHPASTLDRLDALLREGLWQPLAGSLGGLRRLHVVTHGSFHRLPLACGAPDGVSLSIYPGFVCYHRLHHPHDAEAVGPLAAGGLLGMAVHAAQGEPGLPAIPFVEAEAQIVRSLWPGEVQSDPALAQAHPALAALQLAGHGQVDPKDPARAGLLLGSGMLDLHAVLGAKQRPAVVLLSACTVGRTADDPDGEPLGLVGGFLLKGARIVIASLQPVPDFYMPLLMALFHRSWRDGASPVEALADAKRRLAQGRWQEGVETLVRRSYRGVLVETLAGAQRELPTSAGVDPLLVLTHAWLFPARYRQLHPTRDGERLAELRALVATPAGRQAMGDAVLQTLVDERERLPAQPVDTLCTWVVAFGHA